MSGSDIPVLFVAYHFPPDAAVGGKRAAGFCRYLPAFQIRPLVVTVKEQFYGGVDTSFPLSAGLQIERTDVHSTPADWYTTWKRRLIGSPHDIGQARTPGDGQSAPPSEPDAAGFLRRNALSLLDIPDAYWGWYWPAVRASSRIIRRERVRAVISSSPPLTPHLIAGHLARKFKLPWIADFRDVWLDLWNTYRRIPQWRKRLDLALQDSWVRRADLVLCSTDASRDVFVEHYSKEPPAKFVTLTNGFDDIATATTQQPLAPGLQLVLHTGNLYGGRTVDTLCQAVAELVDSKRVNASTFKLLFLGNKDARIEAAARATTPDLFLSGCVEFRPAVPWAEAQRAVSGATVLLVVQGGQPVAVPAKFYEYLQTGKPIFALVCEGALSRMIESAGAGSWSDPRDVSRIADTLYAALRMPQRTAEQQAAISNRFHYRSLTAQLSEHIRRVTREGDSSTRARTA